MGGELPVGGVSGAQSGGSLLDPPAVVAGARQDMDLGLATAAAIHQVEVRDAVIVVVAQGVRKMGVIGISERGGDVKGEVLVATGARENMDFGAPRAGGGGVENTDEVADCRICHRP